MKNITVVMSTFNGSKCVVRQLNSIFNQKDVFVTCLVRDDGSTDSTLDILNSYVPSKGKLIITKGENVGWEHSFMLALKESPDNDYYAFADQDDVWFADKLINGIKKIDEFTENDVAIMYHCNKISVTEDMKPLFHQVKRTAIPLNRQNAMVQEYAQGCSIIMNKKAKQLVTSYLPQNRIAHDFWCGLICYLFGNVIYDNIPQFYHISYGNNASGEGHLIGSWLSRFKSFFSGNTVYYMPYSDLEEGFKRRLTDSDLEFLYRVKTYKKSLKNKLSLLFSINFVRDSFMGTCSLKLAILLNKL